jgi:3-vinyl bacteriochlorophyllide hydratase
MIRQDPGSGMAVTGAGAAGKRQARHGGPLYTPGERRRRDVSPWTLVQGVLAPVQFAAFLVSLALVFRYLTTGEGYFAATTSIVVKTILLYTIMITGSIWEKAVFGRYLFAPAFFWEDAFSMLALHTAYLITLSGGYLTATEQMLLALTAYLTYVINATSSSSNSARPGATCRKRRRRAFLPRWPDERCGR